MFRIANEKRGGCVIGIRVQQMSHMRDGQGGYKPVWRNRGRRCFTMEQAVELRDFLVNQAGFSAMPIEYDEVPDSATESTMDKWPRSPGWVDAKMEDRGVLGYR